MTHEAGDAVTDIVRIIALMELARLVEFLDKLHETA